MKNIMMIGCATTTLLVGTLCFTAKAADDDNCGYCGTGPVIVEPDDPIPVEPPVEPEVCNFCGSDDGSSSSSSGSGSSGTWWTKARSKTVSFVDSNGKYAGAAKISVSKMSSAGTVAVKLAIKLASGKSGTLKKSGIKPNTSGTVKAKWTKVKNVNTVTLSVTPAGRVSGTVGSYEFVNSGSSGSSALDDGDDAFGGNDSVFVHGSHMISVEVGSYQLNGNYALIEETIPNMIITTTNKKWDCGKTATIKYKKVDGEYELTGFDNDAKTNYSGLTITYNSKSNTFTGSFKVYATNEYSIESGKPSLKSYKFTIKGSISGGRGIGVATCSALKAQWQVTVD